MEEEPEVWGPLTEFLSYHPTYSEVFKESVDQLLYGQGPLGLPTRHFVALMAAARHRCHFLSELHSAEFLRCGGDEAWLSGGLASAPARFPKLDVLNRLLAHQPWSITPAHLHALTKTSAANDSWSLSELMHAAIILSLTHSLASFVKGCGIISSQPPSPKASDSVAPGPASFGAAADAGARAKENAEEKGPVSAASEVELLMARMKAVAEEDASELSPEERAEKFHQVIAPEAPKALRLSPQTSPAHSPHGPRSPVPSPQLSPRPPISAPSPALYTQDPALFEYVDFVKRANPTAFPTFKIHDYAWEDRGFSLVSQLYGELAGWMDGKFRLAQALTYHTMGRYSGVDTRPFRTALWNYIQSLFGIRHDDYDYAQINVLLRRPLKELAKTLVCAPHRCSDALRQGVLTEFLLSERIHVMILVSEARQQSALLYFLRAVSQVATS